MLLEPPQARLFYKLQWSLLCFANQRLKVVSGLETPDAFASSTPDVALEIREAFAYRKDLIASFVESNPFDFDDAELEIVASWRHAVKGKFFIFRYLQRYTVFLSTAEPARAYGVLGLSQPIDALIGPYLPVWAETVLLPFCGKIIYDGLMTHPGISISWGPGMRRGLNESYAAAKRREGIITSLPHDSSAAHPVSKKAKQATAKKASPKKSKAAAGEAHDAIETIAGLVDAFCRENLNDEYATLCRALVDKLARKRPSPLLRGSPNTWACGVVRTIGWVNFLDDRSRQPHLKLTAIDKAFGVAESTGQQKSQLIRKTLRIHQFDHHWTLPSQSDDNPLIWMLEVNGLLTDIRKCPRGAQEAAFEKGLIPYVPADRN